MKKEPRSLLLVAADSQARIDLTRELFREYSDALDIDLCFQNFEGELAALPGDYAPPKGGLWLALSGDRAAGCAGMRPLADGICELKRLYVRPEFRGQGLGRRLAQAAMVRATEIGYARMRLDSLASMEEALALYESLGFRHSLPYCHNPSPHAVFMELELRQKSSGQPRIADYYRPL
jgi:putative acetyltransferase